MGSEILLYGYGMICLSMIIFNLVYGIVMRGKEKSLSRQSSRFEDEIKEQMHRLRKKKPLDEAYLSHLGSKLTRVSHLRAFDQALERCLAEEEYGTVSEYLSQLEPVFLRLADVYPKKEPIQAAYFAYFLWHHGWNFSMQTDTIQEILVDYMKKDSLYCRVNALKALCVSGNPDHVFRAVVLLERGGRILNEKILTECLLLFEGDAGQLIELLWAEMDQFSIRTKRAVLDYIRLQSGDYCEKIFHILEDPEQDKELHFSAIRYLGRYPYPPARMLLLGFLQDKDPKNWEYAAVSAASLASYPGEDVVHALMDAMYSRNWYIRYNAASGLEVHGLSYSDLLELVGGRDRYAREMIMYRLESRRLETSEETDIGEGRE